MIKQIDGVINSLVDDLAKNHMKIYERRHQAIAALLTWFSATEINFEGRTIRGWLDTLLFGESQSGKSETIKHLFKLFGRGGYISGEGLSNVGLQGGIDRIGNAHVTRPGLFSIHNGELVNIDELQGMSVEQFAQLSDVRMSGVAKIQKVKAFQAPAKCRKIWTANPRAPLGSTHTVLFNSETHPINLVRKLVVTYEDLTRFDVIVGYKQSPLDLRYKNKDKKANVGESNVRFLPQLLNLTWNRLSEQIRIPEETTTACYDFSKELLDKYQSDFPMILGAGQPDRMIRLATACAAMTIISDKPRIEDFNNLTVWPDHVAWVAKWLGEVFCEDDLQYAIYAEKYQSREKVSRNNRGVLIDKLKSIKNYKQLLYALYHSSCITLRQLREEAPQIDNMDVVLAGIFRAGLLRSSPKGYYKTDLFNNILQQDFVQETTLTNISEISFGQENNV